MTCCHCAQSKQTPQMASPIRCFRKGCQQNSLVPEWIWPNGTCSSRKRTKESNFAGARWVAFASFVTSTTKASSMLTEKVMVNAMLHRPSSWRLVNASQGEGAGKGATLLNLPQTDFCIWSTRSASHGRLVIA